MMCCRAHARVWCVCQVKSIFVKPNTQNSPNRLHTHTHPPKRLAHPRSPILPLSTLTSHATQAHPTSPRSTGFCAIWGCISTSSSSFCPHSLTHSTTHSLTQRLSAGTDVSCVVLLRVRVPFVLIHSLTQPPIHSLSGCQRAPTFPA